MNSDRRPAKTVSLGVAAGVFSGLFGVGGGSIIVPGALTVDGVDERGATAASLLAITVMALVGSGFQVAYGNLRPLDALVVGIPAIAGVLGGTAIQQRIEPATVRLLFAVLLILVGVATIAGLHPSPGRASVAGILGASAVGRSPARSRGCSVSAAAPCSCRRSCSPSA